MATAKELRKLKFPKHIGTDVKRYEQKYDYIAGISYEQFKKLNHLFMHVYGHRHATKNPGAHHAFLQGIVHYWIFDFDMWKGKLLDSCIEDVFGIAPELFDAKVIEQFYKEIGISVEGKR